MDNKKARELLNNLASSPVLFPEEIDFQKRIVTFSKMSRESYASSSFLDDRKTRIDAHSYKIKLDYLLNSLGPGSSEPAAINWIFHTPHSGSTLVARALDELKGCLALKEPILLIQASSLKRHPKFRQWEQSRDWQRFFTMVQELLSRTFVKTDIALVKTTSVCHNLVQDIFDDTRPSRALFLYSSLEKYLISLYKGNYLDAYLSSGFQGALHDTNGLDLIGIHEAENLPRNRKAALLWLSIVLNLNNYIRDNPDTGILTLDSQQFFAEREAALMTMAVHFGYSTDKSAIEAVINGPVFSSDAKSVKKAWDNREYSNINRRVRADFSAEIEDALYWAEGLTRGRSDALQIPLFSS